MPRNSAFHAYEPLRSHQALELQHDRISGPFSFLNPTRAAYKHIPSSAYKSAFLDGNQQDDSDLSLTDGRGRNHADGRQLASSIGFKWRSRDNRKGRHTLIIDPTSDTSAPYITPRISSSLTATAQGILRMLTSFPYWDVSYLVATIFTLGSCVWVINAFFVYLPLARPVTEFKNEILYGGGISAFIGATIFEIGSILLMIEAVNENNEGCFGWAFEQIIADHESGKKRLRVRPDKGGCQHHHTNKHNLIGKALVAGPSTTGSAEVPEETLGGDKQMNVRGDHGRPWQWFPSRFDLTNHYLRELGFLASLAQLMGASIFWISGFTALPGINNKMSQGLLDGIYWVPQIAGGTGFIISGVLFMLETQEVWYKPAFAVLGWHIGFWNLIGAFGFTLSGALGPAYGNSGAEYEASLATFWGSWAFLIGSVIQWYESLDKNPVERESSLEIS